MVENYKNSIDHKSSIELDKSLSIILSQLRGRIQTFVYESSVLALCRLCLAKKKKKRVCLNCKYFEKCEKKQFY